MTRRKTSTRGRATCATCCRNTTTIYRWRSQPTTRDHIRSSYTVACRRFQKRFLTCGASSVATTKANPSQPRKQRAPPKCPPPLPCSGRGSHNNHQVGLNKNYCYGCCGFFVFCTGCCPKGFLPAGCPSPVPICAPCCPDIKLSFEGSQMNSK